MFDPASDPEDGDDKVSWLWGRRGCEVSGLSRCWLMKRWNEFSGRLLVAYLALVETGQFKLAADYCCVSYSAFSQMISRLEEQLGVRLFNRDTHRVSLTPAGELLLPIARSVAAGIDGMFAEMGDYAEQRKGKIAIAALPSLTADWLPMRLAEYRRDHPDIQLRLHDSVDEPALELVRKGIVAFAINPLPRGLDEFDVELFFNEPYYLICRPDHPLAGRRSIRPGELEGCTYIYMRRAGTIWTWIEPSLQDIAMRDSGLEVQHTCTLAGLIAHGFGQSIVPGLTLFEFNATGLKAVLIDDPGMLRPLYIIRRRGQALSVAAESVLKIIRDKPPVVTLPTPRFERRR